MNTGSGLGGGGGMANSGKDLRPLIDSTCRGGVQFAELYYKVYDTQRHLLSRFYKDHSKLIWNGSPHSGVSSLSTFFQELPPSKFNVMSIDCQPILNTSSSMPAPAPLGGLSSGDGAGNSGSEGDMTILVVVNGQVVFGDKGDVKPFAQTFVLMPSESSKGSFYISSDSFRFT
eukprot:Nk52_evm24s316 gene=Nk52_evmTU24s316